MLTPDILTPELTKTLQEAFMSKIGILTDSVASIPEHFIRELDIHWVAYYIHRGQEVLRDLLTIQRKEFLEWLPAAKVLPKTACPGSGDYIAAYQQFADAGVTEVISIHMTSTSSGAYQAATMAQTMAKDQIPQLRVEVVDTRTVSLCQGWMVIEAARAALAGKDLDDILALIKKMIPVSHMIQTGDTLKYLYMGGRIGMAKHLMGTLLNIKPLIGMENGVIVPLGTARSRQKAYQAMVDMVERVAGKMGKIKIAYVHSGAREDVEKLKIMVEERLTVIESFIAELSPALAVHSGPGTAGLCYYMIDA